jgi:hypothetical protein
MVVPELASSRIGKVLIEGSLGPICLRVSVQIPLAPAFAARSGFSASRVCSAAVSLATR